MGLEAHVSSLGFHLCLNGISGDRAQKSCERIHNTPCVAGPVRGRETAPTLGSMLQKWPLRVSVSQKPEAMDQMVVRIQRWSALQISQFRELLPLNEHSFAALPVGHRVYCMYTL